MKGALLQAIKVGYLGPELLFAELLIQNQQEQQPRGSLSAAGGKKRRSGSPPTRTSGASIAGAFPGMPPPDVFDEENASFVYKKSGRASRASAALSSTRGVFVPAPGGGQREDAGWASVNPVEYETGSPRSPRADSPSSTPFLPNSRPLSAQSFVSQKSIPYTPWHSSRLVTASTFSSLASGRGGGPTPRRQWRTEAPWGGRIQNFKPGGPSSRRWRLRWYVPPGGWNSWDEERG